jgi:hydroxybutyrate-dimer hydrolase
MLPPADARLGGSQCLRELWTGTHPAATRVREGIDRTRASAPRAGLPVVIVHGVDDGLVPMAFTSTPYVQAARAAGRDVRFWQVERAQHFDAFLALPGMGAAYVPLTPYVHAALDRTWAHLHDGAPLPGDARIRPTPRGTAAALDASHLAIPGR